MIQINPSLVSRYLELQQNNSETSSKKHEKSAAVLIPLLQHQGEWSLLFIRRAEVAGDIHSGQVAFPGGRLEANESVEQAAIREAEEEVALRAEDIQLIGRLQDFWSIGGYRVAPVLAQIPWPYDVELQQSEVSRVFTMPVHWLMQEQNYDTKSRELNGQPRDVVYYREYEGEVLWGLTAAIVRSFCDILLVAGGCSE